MNKLSANGDKFLTSVNCPIKRQNVPTIAKLKPKESGATRMLIGKDSNPIMKSIPIVLKSSGISGLSGLKVKSVRTRTEI